MVSSMAPSARTGTFARIRGFRLRDVLIAVFLMLAAWTLLPPRQQEVRNLDTPGRAVVCFGDSLTAGVGAKPGEDIASRLGAALGRTVVNAGISGDTTSAALARVGADVLVHRPGIVVVCLGGNDFLRGVPVETAGENLGAIVRAIHQSGAMVVLGGFSFPSLVGDWADMYARVAKREGCLLVPDLLAGIAGKPELKYDSIHPNAAGYALLAGHLEKPLRDLMRRAGWTG
jgi:lysophospholipase L1-like esterase